MNVYNKYNKWYIKNFDPLVGLEIKLKTSVFYAKCVMIDHYWSGKKTKTQIKIWSWTKVYYWKSTDRFPAVFVTEVSTFTILAITVLLTSGLDIFNNPVSDKAGI